jgi:gluconolactonase
MNLIVRKPLHLFWILAAYIPGFCASINLPASLVQPGTQLEVLATGIRFGEGPAVSPSGTFFFVQTDVPSISRISQGSRTVQDFQNPSRTANGLLCTTDGSIIACEQGRISRIDTSTGVSENLIRNYSGYTLDLCNDLTITEKGVIYFTNPSWTTPITRNNDIYMLSTQGVLTRLANNLQQPNGLEYAVESRSLYLNLFGAHKVVRYALNSDGTLGTCDDFAQVNQPDGCELDLEGNVYVVAHGDAVIHVFDPAGTKLGTISLRSTGESFRATNCSFGWGDDTCLYITATDRVLRLKMNVKGRKGTSQVVGAAPDRAFGLVENTPHRIHSPLHSMAVNGRRGRTHRIRLIDLCGRGAPGHGTSVANGCYLSQ